MLDFCDTQQHHAFEAATLCELLQGVSCTPGEPLAVQIYAVLRESIVTLRLRPGQPLSEKEISICFDSSKTPVREALIRLEEAGLVTVVPRSGTYVTPVRIGAYIEGCFVRLHLESGAVRRAAVRHALGTGLAELEAILQKQSVAVCHDDYAGLFALDEQLHKAFFRMAGIPGVWNVLQRAQAEVHRIRHLKRCYRIRRRRNVLADHRAIVDAIRNGDAASAEQALVEHITPLEREIEQLYAHPGLVEFLESQMPFTRYGRWSQGSRSRR